MALPPEEPGELPISLIVNCPICGRIEICQGKALINYIYGQLPRPTAEKLALNGHLRHAHLGTEYKENLRKGEKIMKISGYKRGPARRAARETALKEAFKELKERGLIK
jgi:hypothetical protein